MDNYTYWEQFEKLEDEWDCLYSKKLELEEELRKTKERMTKILFELEWL